jgi:iron(III) transport system permease protein
MQAAAGLVRRINLAKPFKVTGLLLAALVALPVLVLFSQWATLGNGETEIWQHLFDTKLDRLIGNTLILVSGVGIGVTVIGVSLAALVSLCEFPGRRWFDWALMLPLAIPGYVMAFVYLSLLSFAGPLQTWIRTVFGSSNWFPDIRAAWGVILVMSLVLYPYVYMLARSSFLMQGRNLLDAGRSLGLDTKASFFRIVLPVARPAIAGGLALALMETLADFGAVSVLSFDTFTTAIYSAWYGLFNQAVAAQLSTLLLGFVILTLVLEQMSRRQARYAAGDQRPLKPYQLKGARAWGAFAWCLAILLIAFVVPVTQLVLWVLETGAGEYDSRYPEFLGHTVGLASIAAVLAGGMALLLSVLKRMKGAGSDKLFRALCVRLATMGYAIPGTVLAMGITVAFTYTDRTLMSILGSGPFLAGSVSALVLAYLTRFLAAAYAPVDAAIDRMKPSMIEAARSLGTPPSRIVRQLYLPALWPGFLTAAIIVFVDVMKEMPATLIIRPPGWDTLAVRVYQMTAEGQWERAALPALTLLVVGLLPVILLVRRSKGSE